MDVEADTTGETEGRGEQQQEPGHEAEAGLVLQVGEHGRLGRAFQKMSVIIM